MFNFQNFGDKGRKSHFLYNRCIHPRRSIALMFVTEKPEWWGCLTVKNLRICSAVSTEYRRVTDGQTDIYAYASRDKNQRGDITLTARRCEVSVRLSNIIFLIFYLFFCFSAAYAASEALCFGLSVLLYVLVSLRLPCHRYFFCFAKRLNGFDEICGSFTLCSFFWSCCVEVDEDRPIQSSARRCPPQVFRF